MAKIGHISLKKAWVDDLSSQALNRLRIEIRVVLAHCVLGGGVVNRRREGAQVHKAALSQSNYTIARVNSQSILAKFLKLFQIYVLKAKNSRAEYFVDSTIKVS